MTPVVTQNENGLIQIIRIGKSVRHIWVKQEIVVDTQGNGSF